MRPLSSKLNVTDFGDFVLVEAVDFFKFDELLLIDEFERFSTTDDESFDEAEFMVKRLFRRTNGEWCPLVGLFNFLA